MEIVTNDLVEKTIKDRLVTDNPNLTDKMIRNIILHAPLRQYFIEQVKGPLLSKILDLSGKYPKPTKENTDTVLCHVLIDIFEQFYAWNGFGPREDLFHAIERLLIGEVGHDSFYEDRFHVLVELAIEAILDGNWSPRELDHPVWEWTEPKPYGGEHSIVYKILQHREEINKILGR